jgi:trimethylamine-N-oxide reductase (cytochrome c)
MENYSTEQNVKNVLSTSDQPLVVSEKTVIKSLALGGCLNGGAPSAVDIKNGRIIRVRPLHFDWKFPKE